MPAVELFGASAPHRGQWLQSGSSGVLQDSHDRGAGVLAAAGATVVFESEASTSPDTPFLNSFIDVPRDLAISGSRFAPKKKSTMARPISRSCDPNITHPPYATTYLNPSGVANRTAHTAPLPRLLPCLEVEAVTFGDPAPPDTPGTMKERRAALSPVGSGRHET